LVAEASQRGDPSVEFVSSDVHVAIQNLSMKVRFVHEIVIGDEQRSNTSPNESEGSRATEAPQADEEHF
jgi:hypothetical protein